MYVCEAAGNRRYDSAKEAAKVLKCKGNSGLRTQLFFRFINIVGFIANSLSFWV